MKTWCDNKLNWRLKRHKIISSIYIKVKNFYFYFFWVILLLEIVETQYINGELPLEALKWDFIGGSQTVRNIFLKQKIWIF